jgi:uncharacterized membrane protein
LRTILVSAVMSVLGQRAGWLPRWLHWLPHLDIEGGDAPASPPGQGATSSAQGEDGWWRRGHREGRTTPERDIAMTIGPVQLLVLGFDQPTFQGQIMAELQRLRDNDVVRLVDGLAVYKDADGNVSRLRETQLTEDEMADFGATVGALIGLGADGQDGMAEGADAGAELVEEREGLLDADDAWDVLGEIPEDSAAALLLIEHRWAIPLRDSVAQAGGMRLASEFISPIDLVAIGMTTADEARALVAVNGETI